MLLTRFAAVTAALVTAALATLLTSSATFLTTPARPIVKKESTSRQDIVTWDEHSLLVRGERILFYSGEFHPFRLPVPDLWPDVFQKIKSLGYNGVSFYVNWALLEGEQGVYRAEGIFALKPFFQAASEAGIYLLARPGSHINGEVSGGGCFDATNLYAQEVASTIAKAQITNGVLVILYRPVIEYTFPGTNIPFPNSDYFQYVEDQALNAGIVVPLINNDAFPLGIFSPDNKSVTAHADIYGHDGYPLGLNCSQPYDWADDSIPTTWRELHELEVPSTAYSIVEF